jgi:CubicO group peptidase (beta-lactamase class C family)
VNKFSQTALRGLVSSVLAISLVPFVAIAAPVSDPALKSAVDHAVQAFFRLNPQSCGVSIGLYRDGKTYTFNYGTTSPGGTTRPTARTLYPIASITKTFTGTLLADASLEGKLHLDDDVRKYLDGNYPNLEYEGHIVRLFDLVDHRSGLPFFIPDLPETRPDFAGTPPFVARIANIEKSFTRQDFYRQLHDVKLTGIPGDKAQYSNAGAMLAGYIIERVYGEPYEQLVKNKILTPVGMNSTTITLAPAQLGEVVKGYDGSGAAMPDDVADLQGAGAFRSNVTDMLKYTVWQIKEADPAVKLSHQPYAVAGNYAAGLNWQMLSAPGKRLIWQTGNLDGFHSYLVVEPELKIGLVALFNETDSKSNPAHGELVNGMLKILNAEAILLP